MAFCETPAAAASCAHAIEPGIEVGSLWQVAARAGETTRRPARAAAQATGIRIMAKISAPQILNAPAAQL